MGISGLLPFIKIFGRQYNIRTFSGQKVAIDASCWIHKGLYISINQSGNREGCADIFKRHLQIVIETGVVPIVVFDGLPLPAKASEHQRRHSQREDLLKRAAEPNISEEQARKLRSQAVSIVHEDVENCINVCKNENVKYLVSPYESDAQITYLVKKGHADFALTEDSDLLAYGCDKVMVKVSMNGDGTLFILNEVIDGLQLTFPVFQNMCIAAGCDYLKNIKGFGIKKSYGLSKSQGSNFLEVISNMRGAPANYTTSFDNALAVFRYQTVFDIKSCKTVRLQECLVALSVDLQIICGNILDNSYANDIAVGNINLSTGEKVQNNSHFLNTLNGTDGMSTGTCDEEKEFVCEIVSIERSSFHWKIPQFPVMCLEFSHVTFQKDMELCDGVVQTCELTNICLGKFKCISHCKINIGGKVYIVLWKLERNDVTPANSDATDIDEQHGNEVLPDEEETIQTTHCLPFKVLGTCHSTSRQNALEKAFMYMEEYNRPVFAKIEAEPENVNDKHAIAIYVMSELDYEKVGYIPSELTKYIHPIINDRGLDVDIHRIRFCTTFQKIGFYLTINITKKGLWDNAVIQASKNVR